MIQSERHGHWALLKVAAPCLIITYAYATVVLVLEERVGDHLYGMGGQIGSVFGIAVAFFLGFRMNSSYDRWWEARKILGELNNAVGSFCCKVCAYFGNPVNLKSENQPERKQIALELIERMRLYAVELKNELLDTSTGSVPGKNKATHEVLLDITVKIEEVFAATSPLEKSDLMQHLNRFFDIQGKAERIKNTPFLMIYTAFTRLIVLFYVACLPFFIGDIDPGGEASRLEYLAPPILALISTVFLTINRLSNLYAEPFGANPTALPLATIFETIDRTCAQIGHRLTPADSVPQ